MQEITFLLATGAISGYKTTSLKNAHLTQDYILKIYV